MTTLVFLSGGIDSTAALKYILTEEWDDVLVHHYEIITNEHYYRHVPQKKAVYNIVPYMRRKFRYFEFTESKFDLRQIAVDPVEMFICYAMAGLIAHNKYYPPKGDLITKFVVGECLEEIIPDGRIEFFRKHLIKAAAWKTPAPKCYIPTKSWAKVKNIEYIGSELFKMTWACTTPIKENNKYIECEGCYSCKMKQEAIRRIK